MPNGEEIFKFYAWLEEFLRRQTVGTGADARYWTPEEVRAEFERVMKWIGTYGFSSATPYYSDFLSYYGGMAETQAGMMPEAPTLGVTGGYELETVGGYNLGILRDDAGNVVDTINLGTAEEGGITSYQQAQLDQRNQEFQFQQQQWITQQQMTQQQFGWQQQQWITQQQMAQQEMAYQATFQQQQMDLAQRQYMAEVMAEPSRWIEAYYAGEMPPWTPPAMPEFQIPEIPIPEQPPWVGAETFMEEYPYLTQQLPLSLAQQRTAGITGLGGGYAYVTPEQIAQSERALTAGYKAPYVAPTQDPSITRAAAYTGRTYEQQRAIQEELFKGLKPSPYR